VLESLRKEDEADGSEWLWSSVYGYNKPWVVVYPPATMVELSFTGEIFVWLYICGWALPLSNYYSSLLVVVLTLIIIIIFIFLITATTIFSSSCFKFLIP
jgi:hypothetical protein